MDYDYNELLAAMYQDAGKPPPSDKPEVHIETPGFKKTRTIRVGIIEYEVPTVEYVNRLEQVIARQNRVLEDQRRTLERFEASLRSTRSYIRRQTNHIDRINEELDHKVDLGGYT